MPKFEAGVIADRVDFTTELAVFRIATQAKLNFKPGQFATLALEQSGRLLQRPYSIVSSPHEDLLEFFIELVPEGLLTPMLWDLKPGDAVMVRDQAAGAFLLDGKSGLSKHMMISTVTGIAPFISMLRTHAYTTAGGAGPDASFLLLQGASYARDFGPYRDEMLEMSRHGWLTYIDTVSRPLENPDWRGEVGRVDDLVRKYADELGYDSATSVAYACGNPVMVENVKSILTRARFPKGQILSEKYFPIKSAPAR